METQKKTLETKKDSIQLLGPLDMSPVDWAGRFPRSRLTSIKVICKISGVFIWEGGVAWFPGYGKFCHVNNSVRLYFTGMKVGLIILQHDGPDVPDRLVLPAVFSTSYASHLTVVKQL